MVWNYHGPRWRGRPEVEQIREEDTDWRRWLLHKPYRPFDPRAYFEFRLYKDFSSGIADQWMSHGIDLMHYFLDDSFPKSVVAHGGVFAWQDGRENPDTFQALLEYPKGFLVSFSTSFGNDSDSFSRIMGKKATLVNIGGEGSPRWKWVEEKGNHEDNPYIKRAEKYVLLPGTDKLPPPGHGRHGPLPHDQLVRVPAQPQGAECYRAQRLSRIPCRDHGGARLPRRQEALLGSEGGTDRRSPGLKDFGE